MGQTWSCCCLCNCRDELVDLARIVILTILVLIIFWKVYLMRLTQNCYCALPAAVEFYSSGFDSNDVSTFPRSYPIVLIGICFASQIFSYKYLELINLKGFWLLYCNSLYFRWDCPLFTLIEKLIILDIVFFFKLARTILLWKYSIVESCEAP